MGHLRRLELVTIAASGSRLLLGMRGRAPVAPHLLLICLVGSQQSSPVSRVDPNQTSSNGVPAPQSRDDLLLTWTDVEKDIWQNAKPYMDESVRDLEKEIPELQGLTPATSQEELNSILSRVGERCLDLLRRTPNVIADEQVNTYVSHLMKREQEYSYLVIVSQTAEGSILNEYRTDARGTPVSESSAPWGLGFASMWAHFFPATQPESRFRYLGTQKIENQEVMVVAFAQIPDKVKFRAEFNVGGARISILYQGVAWIDPETKRILRMREDLLAPRPDAKLTKFTAKVRYGAVVVKNAQATIKEDANLWLPQEADLDWNLAGQVGGERHTYSNYRLYVVKSRVVF